MTELYHVSENGEIEAFEPRPPPSIVNGHTDPCVWAIDQKHLVNYLLPRDCPRVTCYAKADTTVDDQIKTLGKETDRHLIAIESRWLQRCQETSIWIYQFSADHFTPLDEGAGYYISDQTVIPRSKKHITDCILELQKHPVELRMLPNLWTLRDTVVESTFQFSCIRMRNAIPRTQSSD